MATIMSTLGGRGAVLRGFVRGAGSMSNEGYGKYWRPVEDSSGEGGVSSGKVRKHDWILFWVLGGYCKPLRALQIQICFESQLQMVNFQE